MAARPAGPHAQAAARGRNTNILADFAIQSLHVAAASNAIAVLEFPEDLGRAPKGCPASPWQDANLRRLEACGFTRGAIYQSDWADVPYRKPTGLITNATELVADP